MNKKFCLVFFRNDPFFWAGDDDTREVFCDENSWFCDDRLPFSSAWNEVRGSELKLYDPTDEERYREMDKYTKKCQTDLGEDFEILVFNNMSDPALASSSKLSEKFRAACASSNRTHLERT